MDNLTFWKWFKNNIKFPDKKIFYCFIFIFGGLITLVSTIMFAKASMERTYVGILISLLMIPMGVLILLYGWFKGNVEPYLGGKI